MSILRATTLQHGSSAVQNIVLDNQGRASFGPDGPQSVSTLYVNAQTSRVGVNTESPSVALDVTGAINSTGNVTAGGTLTVTGITTLTNDLVVDTDTLFVDVSTDRIGIGTTSPDQLLHLESSSSFLTISNSGDTGEAGVLFRRTVNDQNRGYVLYDFTNDALKFRTSTNGTGEVMRIDSAGKIGVATTNPVARVHSVGTGTAPSFLASGSAQDYCVPDGEALQIGHWNSSTTTMTTRLLISSAGNVGIGTSTSTPLGVLQTSLNSTDGVGIYLENRADAGASDAIGIDFTLRRAGGYQFAGTRIRGVKENAWTSTPSTINSAITFSTFDSETAAERMRITSDGELLVGTTNNSGMNVKISANAARFSAYFVGAVHDTTNSNNRTVLIHRMDPGSSQGFQFSGHFVVQSFTGNAYIDVHITKLYTSDAVEVDVVSATHSAQISKANVRVVTADYGSARYLGLQKNGGGTGASYINAFLNGNIGQHGGVREVNNSSLGSVTEIAKLNY